MASSSSFLQYESIPEIEDGHLLQSTFMVTIFEHRKKNGPLSRMLLVLIISVFSFSLIIAHRKPVLSLSDPSIRMKTCSMKQYVGPFLYVTLHSKDGILKYSIANGCYFGDKVLKGGDLKKLQLRSVFIGSFNGSEALIVADSTKENSRSYIITH
jgi:hypothetical protein